MPDTVNIRLELILILALACLLAIKLRILHYNITIIIPAYYC